MQTHPLSAMATHYADELRALLRAGALPNLGIVDIGKGARLRFELAINVTLADLARLSAQPNAVHEGETERWHQITEDLERLHQMAVTAPASKVPACNATLTAPVDPGDTGAHDGVLRTRKRLGHWR